ncbi:quinone-dependent dihydroorotate dehydrogenase [Phnomibacter ginsenosidimutans]|uniref:Dihydroorotate dehydrogenase (quinone) n=1 Tax=Phnomibacter ginsenosidimutans TaxID=2676868 RepID=A0A6I6G671_9BACT|nr:quinone-dependent dihydroorotate dehydrogenase [Phnomibacter ginsenosidimutans]QGW26933.1 quinone-dependent dihydroorotate dehydrogenase [Phnomibacter ginsenosidimutans]
MFYKIIRSILFLFPPEAVHHFAMNWLGRICSIGWLKGLMKKIYSVSKPSLVTTVAGIAFPNKVGLAAGFDKNAKYLNELDALGFGFVEIGTVTPRAQDGNPQPRLFRLPEDKALINRMGFNNEGADAAVERLKAWRQRFQLYRKGGQPGQMIIGGNIGKNKTTPNENAYLDYDICFRKLAPYVDFFVVNVSSPNTPGLRALQEKDALRTILVHLQQLRSETNEQLPIFLKIAPDLTDEQIADVASLAIEINLDGIVATNTTISRANLSDAGKIRAGEAGDGGLSGAPVRVRSTEVVRLLRSHLPAHIPIIASGGIFTAADAKEKLDAGAQLVQVWTGFIYEGPAIAKNILQQL